MTDRLPLCDGHRGEIRAGQDYATVVMPGQPDRHLCKDCAPLVWQYLPEIVRHRERVRETFRAPSVRERAMSLDLIGTLHRPGRKSG
jgi:hypothetical protein